MALLFRVGDRFGAEVVQVNNGQASLVYIALQQITDTFIFADFTVSLSQLEARCNPAVKSPGRPNVFFQCRRYRHLEFFACFTMVMRMLVEGLCGLRTDWQMMVILAVL